MNVTDELWVQFRTTALERLERIEAAWSSVLATLDEAAAATLQRELHTLKGESSLLGLRDVGVLCGRLEALLEIAQTRGYAVDDDFDVVVSMAIRFAVMLVRKHGAAHGIDVPAFVRQLDSLLGELRPDPKKLAAGTAPTLKRSTRGSRLPSALRARLSEFAVDAFLEYAMARGERRNRLRASWHGLRELVGLQRAIVGASQLEPHTAGALALARELGRDVSIAIDVASIDATADTLSAVTTAVVHLLRNAIDHGIEPPGERRAIGKSERGQIRVTGGQRADRFELTVEDDGRGVSLERVHARALELGLVTAHADISDRWVELVCRPGFSTRATVDDVSGRGVGLDAVRAAVAELGGTLDATTRPGAGTAWTVTLPLHRVTFDGLIFRVPGLAFPVVADASWCVEPPTGSAVDLARELGFATVGCWTPSYLVRANPSFAIATEDRPTSVRVRRVVATQARTEVVVVDGVEALAVRAP